MKTITAIKAQKRGRDRANIFLDGSFAFSVGREVVEGSGICIGQALADNEIIELSRADSIGNCRQAALRLLNYRPRSESEIRARLKPKYDGAIVDEVILQMRSKQLIDDVGFATFWKENRESFNPRSRRLLGIELRKKGVGQEAIDEVLEGLDDEESAYRAAKKRGRSLPKDDYAIFKRKLAPYLRRRGFSYEVVNRTVERIWRESSR